MTTTVAPPDVRAVVRRRILDPVIVVLAVVAVVCAALGLARMVIPPAVQLVPFAVSILVFGLPHGALDHLVPARMDPRIPVSRSVVAVVALYLLLGGATAVVWVVAPAAGFTAFVLVTWFHWGQGDLWVDRAVRGRPRSRTSDVLTVVVRGGIPMLVPLIAHPSVYGSVLVATARVVTPDAAPGLGWIATPPARAAIAALLAALVVAQLTADVCRRGPTTAGIVEAAVLVAFFVVVPPVLAVGLYFTLWHAVRHIVRLELLDARSAAGLAAGRLLTPLVRFLRAAWPTTLAAVLILVTTALVTRSAGLGVYLVLIAALTTPHSVVVTWMDRRQYRHPPSRGAATR